MSHTYADVKSDFRSAGQDLREAASGIRSEAHQVAEGVRSGFRKAEDKVEAGVQKVKAGAMWQPPAWADITKPTNDLLTKDFYHVAAATLEVKTKAPTGVNFTFKGKSAHDNALAGSIEGKYADRPSGTTGTLSWSTANVLDAKIELENNIAKGLKAEAVTSFKPDTHSTAAKLNLYFKQPSFHLRAFTDLLKGPTATIDAVLGNDGFLVGGEAGYDVQKAAVTRYSAAIGYQNLSHNVAVTATNNLSIFAASYYNRVNSQVEVGARAAWDSKSSSTVGMEVAAKYIIDPLSFAKGKINDRGIAALSYNTRVNGGLTFGVGASFDTQKLNESTHQVGMHLAFEG